jgi:two-component system response regulator MprA
MWKAARRLIPRVSSLAHRSTGDGLLRFGDLTIDPPRRLVLQGERVVDLTPREFALLELFVGNADRVLTRSELYERVWGYDFGRSSNVLGVYVGYLRRKLEAENEPRVIQTARGVGYVLRRVGEDSV